MSRGNGKTGGRHDPIGQGVHTADMLARLDVIAAMWGPDGMISEPGGTLVELPALLDELARGRTGVPADLETLPAGNGDGGMRSSQFAR